jgi:RND family efflux transporter MFP subunit
MPRRIFPFFRPAAAALSLAALAACGGDKQAEAAQAGPAGGGARTPTITLAPSDVATPKRVPLEDAIAVTGNLNALNSGELRSRVEGDVVSVLVREGQPVRAGQLLAQLDPADLQGQQMSAQADVASARTEYRTAQWNLEQSRELLRQGAVPEQQVRVAEQEAAAAQAKLAAAESRLRSASINLNDTRVTAPASGTIDKRLVTPGQHVSKGAALFTMVQGSVLELAAAVPEARAAQVRPGATVHFAANGQVFDGTVARVAPSVDPASRTVTVYVDVPNAGGALKSGTFAAGRIVTQTLGDALVVPLQAVKQGPDGGSFVYRVADGAVEQAPVTLGLTDDAQGVAQVVSGLSDTDRVIVGNVGMLGKGMKVRMAGGPGGGRRGGGGSGGPGGARGAAGGGH